MGSSLCAGYTQDASSPLDWCVGFIDCTEINIARPGGYGSNRRARYSVHGRMHRLIYQSITTPDGLILSLYGPEVGRRHDMTLLKNSGLREIIEEFLVIDDIQYYIDGDGAYTLQPWMQTAFDRATASPSQPIYNTL